MKSHVVLSTPCARSGLAIAPLFVLSISAWANTAPLQTDDTLSPILIESTRLPAKESLRDVQVIRPNQTAVEHSTIVDTLQEAGIVALPTGNNAQLYTLLTRGMAGKQTQFTLDGFRIGSVSAGSASLNTLTSSSIDRIEVIKGESSSLYGSNSMGGTIAVYSKKANFAGATTQPELDLSYEPRYETRDAHLGLSIHSKDSPLSIRFDMSHAKAMGYSILTSNHPFFGFASSKDKDNDGYERNEFSAKISLTPSSDHKIEMVLHDHRLLAAIDFGKTSNFRQELYGLTGEHKLSPKTQLTWKLGTSLDTNESDFNFGVDVYKTTMNQSSLQLNQKFEKGEGFIEGEYLRESLETTTTGYSGLHRSTQALSAGYRLEPAPIGGEFSIRREKINGEAQTDYSKTTFSSRVAFKPHQDILLSLGGGTSFRAPTFNDLYYPSNPAFAPASNPNLLPESARNMEAVLRYTHANLTLQSTFFRSFYKNLIALDDNFTPQNVTKARIQGIELDAHYRFDEWKAHLHETLQNAQDSSTGQTLARRPKQFGFASLEHHGDNFIWGSEIKWMGKRWENAGNTPDTKTSGYVVVDAKVEHPFQGSAKGWSAYLQANNLLNATYEAVQGYATPKATLMIGMRYRPQE